MRFRPGKPNTFGTLKVATPVFVFSWPETHGIEPEITCAIFFTSVSSLLTPLVKKWTFWSKIWLRAFSALQGKTCKTGLNLI